MDMYQKREKEATKNNENNYNSFSKTNINW